MNQSRGTVLGAVVLIAVGVWYFVSKSDRPVEASAKPRLLTSSSKAELSTSANDTAEVERLRAEVARLSAELKSVKSPKSATTDGRYLWFNSRTGLLSDEARRGLGLTLEQFRQGNRLIGETVAELRRIESQHMEAPVMSGDVMLVKIDPYQTATDTAIDALYDQLEQVWPKEVVEKVRSQKRNRIFAGVGAGYADKVVTIRPSTFRPGYIEVIEDAEQVDGRTRMVTNLTPEELAKWWNITLPTKPDKP